MGPLGGFDKVRRVERLPVMRSLGLYLLFAFGWSWGLWWPAVFFGSGRWTPPVFLPEALINGSLAAWGPLVAALLVAAMTGGRKAVRRLGQQMLRWRIGWRMWAVVFGLLPVAIGAAWGVAGMIDGERSASAALETPALLPIVFVWILVLGGPLQEEAGWRATLYAGLGARLTPVTASLGTGAIWAIWHLPLFYLPSAGIYYERPFWGLALSTLMLSILLGWVYDRTGRSLLAVMVMHATFNWAHYVFPALETDTGGLLYFAFMLLACGGVLFAAARRA